MWYGQRTDFANNSGKQAVCHCCIVPGNEELPCLLREKCFYSFSDFGKWYQCRETCPRILWALIQNSRFSLPILSDSAARNNATTSNSENLGTGPRRGIFPFSSTNLLENCLHIPRILTNFVYKLCIWWFVLNSLNTTKSLRNQRYIQLLNINITSF